MAPQILVLGMPRTGTQCTFRRLLFPCFIQTTLTIVAIGQALGMLGYKNAYHMTTVGPHDHHDKWVAALEAKFEGKSTEYGKQEFDELFEGFDVSNAFLAGVVFIIQVAKVTEFTRSPRISPRPFSTGNL